MTSTQVKTGTLYFTLAALATGCFYLGYAPALRLWFVLGVGLWTLLLFRVRSTEGFTVRHLMWGAIAVRVLYLNWPPLLSDDVYRYLWDGLLQHQDLNPFAFLPRELTALTDHQSFLFDHLNSPDYYSVYPPVSQLIFRLATWIAPDHIQTGYVVIKAVYATAEVIGIGVLGRLVRPSIAVLYAWNPIAVVEVAGQGHAEGIVVGALGVALIAHRSRRALWVGALGALAVWVKLIPLFIAPLFLRARRWRLVVVGGAVVTVMLWVPYYAPYVWGHIQSSTELYVRLFEFNAGLYLALKEGLRVLTGEDWSKQLGPFLRHVYLVYWVVIVGCWWRYRWSVYTGILLILGGYVVTATTVHPWYLLPILYIAVIASKKEWLWLGFWSTATYLFYTHGWYWLFVWIGWGGWLVLLARTHRAFLIEWALRLRAYSKSRCLERLTHTLQSQADVLDIGAGEGYVGEALARRTSANVTLTDVEAVNRTALAFKQATETHLPFSDDQFEVSYLYFVLHHARDPHVVIQEALRVTTQRVIVAESVFTTEREYRRLKWLDEQVNRLRGGWMTPQEEHLTFKRTHEWISLIEDAGAELVALEERGRWLHRQAYLVFRPRQTRNAS